MKIKTRELIILTSIKLFNERGMGNVSLREIASEANMSVGNLTYHFPRAEDLLTAIQEKLIIEMEQFPKGPFTFEQLDGIFRNIAEMQLRYSFIFKEIYALIKQFPLLEPLKKVIITDRIAEMVSQLGLWSEEGLVYPDSPVHSHKLITQNVWLIISGWVTQNQLLAQTTYAFTKDDFVHMIWQVYLPHLTDKGRQKVEQLLMSKNQMMQNA